MPGTVGWRPTIQSRVRSDLVLRHPVARIGGVGIAAIAVVGDERIGDEVIAGQDARGELDMWPIAGIDHGDDHAGRRARAHAGSPRIGQIHAARGGLQGPLLRIVRLGTARCRCRGRRIHMSVRFRVFDFGSVRSAAASSSASWP